ncbi:3fbb2736-1e6e-45cf-89f9-99598319e4d7 [Sclerotinia trifoliorum]|uniref:PinX1-related protein 1 n=1 Tax=Sclerotinia trifoliorum TaxID=28548 RepID=A0A8H2ZRK0_9HELO|nr:3fbb2736-1e6e-45cf-89f9-99598319e4d7 [Sclerotinia trifoliorum]
MGLSAPKNKIKLSHDPNNTKWSGNTDSFGHRMMKSQGWTPGEYLGAKDAAHAEFHTAANASHIRVVIKDNNLGLGAKIGSGVGHGECTGLDVFQNLLGRLNGREEAEIEKEQKGREDLKRAIYAERKWGSIRFVKGGVLVGDKIQDLIDGEKERVKALEKGKAAESSSEESDSTSDEEEEEKSPEPVSEKKKSSKRKREEQEEEEKTSSKKSKKDKKRKKRKSEDEDDKDKSELKKSKKSKKDRKSKSKSISESETETLDEAAIKARKKEKKEKKRREKEAATAGTDIEETTSTSKSSKKKSKKDKHKSSSTSESSTKESTPAVTESSGRPTPMGIRSIRARHIAQKRMASMDVASLNQIFMIKSQV